LEAVAYVEEEIDGADGVGGGHDALAIAIASKWRTAVPAGKTRQSTL